MKKFVWIVALLAALALIFTACPTGGGGEVKKPEQTGGRWWLGDPNNTQNGLKDDGTVDADRGVDAAGNPVRAVNNTITLEENTDGNTNYIRIFFDPPNRNFDEIEIEFVISGEGANVSWQNIHVGDLEGERASWGATSGIDYIGYITDSNTSETGNPKCDPGYLFTQQWGHSEPAVDKRKMIMLCLRVNPDVPGLTFTLNDVRFLGLESEPVLQSIEVESPPDKIGYFAGDQFDSTGLVVNASFDKSRYDGPVTGYKLSTPTIPNLTDGYEFAESDVGEDIVVTVAYTFGGVTEDATFLITVDSSDIDVSSVTLATPPARLTYYPDDTFSVTGLSVNAVVNGVSRNVTDSVVLSTPGITNLVGYTFVAGDIGDNKVVTVKYADVAASTTFTIRVRARPNIRDIVDLTGLTYTGNIVLGTRDGNPRQSIAHDPSDNPAIVALPGTPGVYHLGVNFVDNLDISAVENIVLHYSIKGTGDLNGGNLTFRTATSQMDANWGPTITATTITSPTTVIGNKAQLQVIQFYVNGKTTIEEIYILKIEFTGTYVAPVVDWEENAVNINIALTEDGEKLGLSTTITTDPENDRKEEADWGTTYFKKVFISFDAPGKAFDDIEISFTYANGGGNVSWWSAYDDVGEWNFNGGSSYIGWFGWTSSAGSGKTPASSFNEPVGGISGNFNSAEMNCLALEIETGNLFTITGIKFIKYE